MNVFSLEGRRALVTGGSRGLGADIVKLFAEQGAQVGYCQYGDDENAHNLAEKMARQGLPVVHTRCNVADETSVDSLGEWALEQLGGVDILVNCAGIGGDLKFHELSIEAFDQMIAVHLRGTFLVTRQFFQGMINRRWGRVINFSSQLAFKGAPGQSHYCAAKGGIVGFTRALAYEGAPYGVTVNAIAPGPVETDMLMGLSDEWRDMKQAELPIGRFGFPREIAPTALLLASEAGSFYVGQNLSPNGGDVML